MKFALFCGIQSFFTVFATYTRTQTLYTISSKYINIVLRVHTSGSSKWQERFVIQNDEFLNSRENILYPQMQYLPLKFVYIWAIALHTGWNAVLATISEHLRNLRTIWQSDNRQYFIYFFNPLPIFLRKRTDKIPLSQSLTSLRHSALSSERKDSNAICLLAATGVFCALLTARWHLGEDDNLIFCFH